MAHRAGNAAPPPVATAAAMAAARKYPPAIGPRLARAGTPDEKFLT